MGSGKVDVRIMQRNAKARLRFYNVAPDQLEVIMNALEIARNELGTGHDTVALDAICIHFLSTFPAFAAASFCSKDCHSGQQSIKT